MKKLSKKDLKKINGGYVPGEEDCCETGKLCNRNQKCCDKTKGYNGVCPSQEAARCD